MTEEHCKELINIQYKNILLNQNDKLINKNTENNTVLDDFLEKNENQKNNIQENIKSWSQLNKMEKNSKINNYIDSISSEYNLSSKDIDELKKYLRECLNKKMLLRIKEVQYDKSEGVIKKINGLVIKTGKITDKERKFTLKNSDKKDSTLKNLGSGKIRKKNKEL
jgi:hypothetical protein